MKKKTSRKNNWSVIDLSLESTVSLNYNESMNQSSNDLLYLFFKGFSNKHEGIVCALFLAWRSNVLHYTTSL